jgi:hypothetical protein
MKYNHLRKSVSQASKERKEIHMGKEDSFYKQILGQ